jgi:hypothetical protein
MEGISAYFKGKPVAAQYDWNVMEAQRDFSRSGAFDKPGGKQNEEDTDNDRADRGLHNHRKWG